MAVPNYAYLKMKMPGNNGMPLTVRGSFLRSDNCDKEFNRISSKFRFKTEHVRLDDTVDHKQPIDDGQKPAAEEFNANTQTKSTQVHPTEP